MPLTDRPLERAYFRIERERRFLLDRLPNSVVGDDYERLDDLYVAGTFLRLRQVHRPDGQWLATKLGQKIPNPEAPDDPRQRRMTTIYLAESEIASLASLQGLRTSKRRYKIVEQGWTFCIDVWESPLGVAGTMLSEVEAPSMAELEALRCPIWAVREVTDDSRYSAIALAHQGQQRQRDPSDPG